jgi:hypothetical protein
LVFIELAMLLLMPVTTTWLISVTALVGFLRVRLVSAAFALASCVVLVLAAGGGFGAVCAEARPKPAMASNAAAQAAANGRQRACARDPCNAQRDFMMTPLLGVESRRRRQAELARGTCCAWTHPHPAPARVAELPSRCRHRKALARHP